MISSLVKPLIPFAKKQLENGKIDQLLDNVKVEFCKDFQIGEHSTIEYMITKQEFDGKSCHLVSFVELTPEDTVNPLKTYKLSEVIDFILNKI